MLFPGAVKTKLPNTGTTIFTIMSALAKEHGAINLSQGFPDFNVDPKLISLVHENMLAGHNQYAPMPGIPALREVLAQKLETSYGTKIDPEKEITITAGGTQALYTAIAATIREGDEVIVFEPAYDSYVPAIRLHGGIPVQLQLSAPDFQIDWSQVKKAVTAKTRMIIINTPHNPTGTVMSAKDMQQLEKIVHNRDIFILSDEVYEHIIFDGHTHQSVLRYPKLAERSFVVFSFGKTVHATGWKTGYCVAPENLMVEFRRIHQYMVFAANTPLQYALASYLSEPATYQNIPAFYQRKRDLICQLLSKSKFEILPCYGSYFLLLDYTSISDEKDTVFAERITREHGVATIPVSVFCKMPPKDMRLIRVCFAKEDQTLATAAEKLCAINN
ncbi:MAG: methionine aminotransferase [Bacteroidota bacterium]